MAIEKQRKLGKFKDSLEWQRRIHNIEELKPLFMTLNDHAELNDADFAKFIGKSLGFYRNMRSANSLVSEQTISDIEKKLNLVPGELDKPVRQPSSYKPLMLECVRLVWECIAELKLDIDDPVKLVDLTFASALENKKISKQTVLHLIAARSL